MVNCEEFVKVVLDGQEESSKVLVGFNYTHEDGYDVQWVESEEGDRLYWDEASDDLKEQVYDALEDGRDCCKRFPAMSGARCLKMFG